jgi:hypothetical protein
LLGIYHNNSSAFSAETIVKKLISDIWSIIKYMSMKQVYYYLFLVLLVFSSVNAKADTPVKINIDDVNKVSVKVNYVSVANLVNGVNEVTIPQYGSLTIEAKEGFYLKDVTKQGADGAFITQNISNLTSCNIYLSDADKNKLIKVKSGVLADARTGSCTVKVDKASKVRVSRYESQTSVALQDGENTVKWIPNTEKTLVISNANYGDAPIYKVTLDGNDVASSGGQYFVTLTAGCVVDIKADYPDVSYPVKFNFSNEAAKGVISKVMADGVEVKNYNDADFKLKAGTKLSLTFDQSNYALDAFKVNGTAVTIYGNYECYVKDNLTFDVQAHKYATVKAVLTVDNAANITAYEGQSYNNKVITLQNGSNNIELGEKNNLIQIKPNSGCKVESLKVNGNPVTANYEGAYEIRLTEGMTIEVTTSAIVRDQKATVVIDDISLANYGFNFYRSDHSTVKMQTGENTVMFSADDHHFMLGAYGNDLSKMVVKLNGTELNPSYPGSTSFEFDLNNGDRLEVLLKGDTAGIDAIEAVKQGKAVVYRLDGTRVEGSQLPNGVYVINGKKIIIKK